MVSTFKKVLSVLLSLVLLIGLGIAVTATYQDIVHYRELGGAIFHFQRINGIKNPLATPCPYGAIAFLIAYIWSLKLGMQSFNLRLSGQRNLNWLLLGSTIFAWSNFIPMALRFWAAPAGQGVGCSAEKVTSPFVTACFGGSVSFLTALILGLWIWSLAAALSAPKN